MQALKALVIIMGVLIVGGMGLLVYGLVTRVSWESEKKSVAAGPSVSFGEVVSTLPEGATIAGVSVDGGRAIVDIRLSDGGAELRVFDLSTGAPAGNIRLEAK